MAEKKDDRTQRQSETEVREKISRERERQAHTQGRAPERKGAGETGKALEEVVDRILELPFGAQLGVLRTVAPRIVGQLEGRDQESFLRELQSEIDQIRSSGQ